MNVADDASSWRVGDEIVIAVSSFEPTEAERVKISGVAGKTVTFAPALKFAHWGTLQIFDGKVIDERAEVGLLTRDIIVQGANDSTPGKFGGHAMMMGAVARVEGVEFRQMGQAGFKGRYSFHWHLAGDRPNDYFKNNSVHDSFQRAVVVHQTNKVLVENNVGYNIFNHMFIPAEDGNEQGNRFIKNLGVLVKSPLEEDCAFRVESTLFGNSTQGEFRSSVFWAKNFGNTYQGNHAAGAQDGNGFFFDAFNSLTQPDDNEPLVFDGNVAHSIQRIGARGMNAETCPEMTFGHGGMFGGEGMRNVERKVTNSTVYKSFGGFWAEDRALRLEGLIAADNGGGVFVLRSVLNGVTIVSQTANIFGTRPFAGDHFMFQLELVWDTELLGYLRLSKWLVLDRIARCLRQGTEAVVKDFQPMTPQCVLELLPGIGVGPVLFGMNPQGVISSLAAIGLHQTGSRDADLNSFAPNGLLYFAENALQVEFIDGLASFIGLANSELFEVRLYGIDPFDTAARDVFRIIASHEPEPHRYDRAGYVFPTTILTLYEADKQYDRLKGRRMMWGQIGLGDERYLEVSNRLEGNHQ